METIKLLYTVDDFEKFAALPENRDKLLELIYGEINEKMPTEKHSILAGLFFMFFMLYSESRKLGYPSVETRHRLPHDKHNARMPDVSFRRANSPIVEKGAVPQMPDLAVEIQSPDDKPSDMREKAAYYLHNGSEIVWLVFVSLKLIEVCTLSEDGAVEIETVGIDGVLSGGTVLPGFTLPVKSIFERDIFDMSDSQ
jgi:Uma2 family endonuclease